MIRLNRFFNTIKFCWLVIGGGAGLMWQSCATKAIQPKYYILDYKPVLRDSSLMLPRPFPYKVQVQTMKIPRTFDRVSIVVRYSAHRLDYYRYNLWAIRPQITISDLIADHISKFNIFKKCQREFLEERPDYEIVGIIEAIEKFDHPQYTAAHLALKLYLRTFDGYENLLVHEFDRTEEMPVFEMELFAQKLSDILEEEVNNFIRKIIAYFNQKSLSPNGT